MKKDTETIPWGIHAIKADLTLEENYNGNNVNIAVLDTGCTKHPDLKVKGGISFVANTVSYSDDNGHGTHVTGIIAAVNNRIGVVGVSPKAEIYAVKVLDQNGCGTYSQVIDGIEWAIDNKIDIINMSFGGIEDSMALHDMIKEATNRGVLIVAAAGNNGAGEETEVYPARYPEVLSVGAVDQSLQSASYSSTGNEIDLVAPGSDVISTTSDGGYGVMSGTSMATPHVTGAVAVFWSKNKKWSNGQVKEKLYQTATPLGAKNIYGNGLVNVANALGLTDSSITPTPQPTPQPTPNPDIPFEIVKKDVQFAEYKNKLRNMYEMANKNSDTMLAKSIEEKLNGLIIAENKVRVLPDDLNTLSKNKEMAAEAQVQINSYYATKSEDFMKLEYSYQEAIDEYICKLQGSVSGSVYESSDSTTIQSAQVIYLNTPIDVNLATGSQKIYQFTPSSSGTYNMFTGPYAGTGGSNDTYLELYTDSALTNRIAYDDDSAGNLFSKISKSLTGGTTYYIKLRPYNSNIAVHARLTVSKVVPIQTIYLDTPIDTQVAFQEYNIFRFTPAVQGLYKFYTGPYAGTGNSDDTYLELYTDQNLTNMIAYDDDSAGNYFSLLQYELQANISYYLKFRGYDYESTSARLTVTNVTVPVLTALLETSTKIVIINGRIASGVGKQLAIEVFNPKQNIENIGQLTCDNSGNFIYSFKLKSLVQGTYQVIVCGENIAIPGTTTFDYISSSQVIPITLAAPSSTVPVTKTVSFMINKIPNATILVPDAQFEAAVNITNNNITNKQNILVSVALFGPDRALKDFVTIGSQLPAEGTDKLGGGFLLPHNVEGYKVSVFVWEGSSLKETSLVPLSSVVSMLEVASSSININAPEIDSTTSATNSIWDNIEKFNSRQADSESEITTLSNSISVVAEFTPPYLEPNVILTAKIKITNNQSVSQDVLPIFQLLNNKCPQELGYFQMKLAPKESRTITYSISLPNDISKCEFDVFIWNMWSDSPNWQSLWDPIRITAHNWYRFTIDDAEIYLSDIGGNAGENTGVIYAIAKQNGKYQWRQYALIGSTWIDTDNYYAYAPGQGGGAAAASLDANVIATQSVNSMGLVNDIQQAINNKKNQLLNIFYNKVGIDPLSLTDDEKLMLANGVIFGLDDNVCFGVAQWILHVTPAEDDYCFMRAKTFTDAVFTAAYTVGAAGSAAEALRALDTAGLTGAMALATSETGVGGVVFGAAAVSELAEAAVMTGISFVSTKMADRSRGILRADSQKLDGLVNGPSGVINRTGKMGWRRNSGNLDNFLNRKGYTKSGNSRPGDIDAEMQIYDVYNNLGKKVGEIHINQPIKLPNGTKTGKYEPLHFEECDANGNIPYYAIHEWFPEMYGWRA